MDITETPYSSKEVVERISIADSTLRKWCIALEEQNYNFVRTEQNKRLFSEKDVFVLSQFKMLVQDKHLSINNAASVIAAKYIKEMFSDETEIEQVFSLPSENETLEELKTEIEQLKDLNRMLLSRLDEQQKYIEERFDIQNEALTVIKEFQEAQKQIAATTQEKKGLLSRLFGK